MIATGIVGFKQTLNSCRRPIQSRLLYTFKSTGLIIGGLVIGHINLETCMAPYPFFLLIFVTSFYLFLHGLKKLQQDFEINPKLGPTLIDQGLGQF